MSLLRAAGRSDPVMAPPTAQGLGAIATSEIIKIERSGPLQSLGDRMGHGSLGKRAGAIDQCDLCAAWVSWQEMAINLESHQLRADILSVFVVTAMFLSGLLRCQELVVTSLTNKPHFPQGNDFEDGGAFPDG